jgi:hypothetical protein
MTGNPLQQHKETAGPEGMSDLCAIVAQLNSHERAMILTGEH